MTISQKQLRFVDCVSQITFIHCIVPEIYIVISRVTKYNHPYIFINSRLPCYRLRSVPQIVKYKPTLPAVLNARLIAPRDKASPYARNPWIRHCAVSARYSCK